MCVKGFCAFLPATKFGKNDKRWFPRWIRRYAESVNVTDGPLPITEDLVIRFSRSLRDHAVPAWQRLQAVRAVDTSSFVTARAIKIASLSSPTVAM